MVDWNKNNEEINHNKYDFQINYEDKIKKNYFKNSENMNKLDENKYKKLFEILNYDLTKSSFMALNRSNEKI